MSSGERPAPRSTLRFEAHRAVVLDRVARAWEKTPQKRLGELLAHALEHARMLPEQLEALPDDRLCELLERAALLGAGE